MGGISLNDILLPGPDLMSNLLDVLMKFRIGQFSFTADIDAMFYQVLVPESDRDFLRFLWFKNSNINGEIKEYRMKVHLFGACSSPSVATHTLQRLAEDESGDFMDGGVVSEAAKMITSNFYVEDCLIACSTENEMIEKCQAVRNICAKGGFNLGKYVSKSTSLLGAMNCVNAESASEERALGVVWNFERDRFGVNYVEGFLPNTRRKLLSYVAKLFDPFGIAAPLVLKGRHLVKESFCRGENWDLKFADGVLSDVKKWTDSLSEVASATIERCVCDDSWKGERELHVFADASEIGHSVVMYVRHIEENGKSVCRFLWGKVRINPTKNITIPRLELMAATMACKMRRHVEEVLPVEWLRISMWTDSNTVLN